MTLRRLMAAALLGALTVGTVEARTQQARLPDPQPLLIQDSERDFSIGDDLPITRNRGLDGFSGPSTYGSVTDLSRPMTGSSMERLDDPPPGGDRPTRRSGGDPEDDRGLRPSQFPR